MTGKHAAVTTPVEDQGTPALVLSNSTYEALRVLVEVILPGVSAFYMSLTPIWDLPGSEKVTGTIAAFTVFVGLFVRLARRSYNKSDAQYDGTATLLNQGGQTALALDLDAHPDDLAGQKKVVLKVNSTQQ